MYRANLLSVLKDIEDQKLQLSVKVQNIKLGMKDWDLNDIDSTLSLSLSKKKKEEEGGEGVEFWIEMTRQFMLHFSLAFLSTPFNCKENYLFHDLYPALPLGECLYGRVELNLVGLGEQLY